MADAGQSTGEETVTPTETGAEGKQADAGQPENREAGEAQSKVDPQEIYDSAFAKARRTFEAKEQELREELEALRGRMDESGKSKNKEADADIQRQIDELNERHQQREQDLMGKLEKANSATARAALIEALTEAGVDNAEFYAEHPSLANRVKADVVEDSLTVFTPAGSEMLNTETGKPATVSDIAREFAQNHPNLVRDRTKSGSGFDRGGSGKAPSYDDQIRQATRKGDLDAIERLTVQRIVGGAQ